MKSRAVCDKQQVLNRDMRQNMAVFSPDYLNLTEETPLNLLQLKFEDGNTVASSGSLQMQGSQYKIP